MTVPGGGSDPLAVIETALKYALQPRVRHGLAPFHDALSELAGLRGRLAETETWLQKTERENLSLGRQVSELDHEVRALRVERDTAVDALRRAAYVAEHLWQMIDRETWREHGAEWMGQYEGDYHAEQVQREIESWKALAAVGGTAAP